MLHHFKDTNQYNSLVFFLYTLPYMVRRTFDLFCPQTMIKDPKVSGIVMNPHVKRGIKMQAVTDILIKAKMSPITINLISECINGSLS